MDSVRLGRVLGRGARGAAKTLLSAVDAASAPNPRPSSGPGLSPDPSPDPRPDQSSKSNPTSDSTSKTISTPTPAPTHGQTAPPRRAPAAATSRTPRPTPTEIAAGTRRFGTAVTAPLRRFSGVLWLEFTGFFFGLFALSAAVGAWRLRAALHTSPGDPDRLHFFLALAIAAVFAWFCLSSFARASRRGRRP